jgi:hypothetical protein
MRETLRQPLFRHPATQRQTSTFSWYPAFRSIARCASSSNVRRSRVLFARYGRCCEDRVGWEGSRAKVRHDAAATLGTRPSTLRRNRMIATAQHVPPSTSPSCLEILKTSNTLHSSVRPQLATSRTGTRRFRELCRMTTMLRIEARLAREPHFWGVHRIRG